MKKRILSFLCSIFFSLSIPANAEDYLRYWGIEGGQYMSSITTAKIYSDTYGYAKEPPIDEPILGDRGPHRRSRNVLYSSHIKHFGHFLNIYSGYRLSETFALEVGAYKNHSFSSSKNKREGQSKLFGMHIGLVMFAPITDYISIIPGFSLMKSCLHVYKPGEVNIMTLKIIPRLMLASQVRINDRFNFRGSIVLNKTDGIRIGQTKLNNIVNIGIGFNYNYLADTID